MSGRSSADQTVDQVIGGGIQRDNVILDNTSDKEDWVEYRLLVNDRSQSSLNIRGHIRDNTQYSSSFNTSNSDTGIDTTGISSTSNDVAEVNTFIVDGKSTSVS